MKREISNQIIWTNSVEFNGQIIQIGVVFLLTPEGKAEIMTLPVAFPKGYSLMSLKKYVSARRKEYK